MSTRATDPIRLYRLDAGPSTLLLAEEHRQVSCLYFGGRLEYPVDAGVLDIRQPGTAHGELDVSTRVPLYPGDAGIPTYRPAFAVSIDGTSRRLQLALESVSSQDRMLIVRLREKRHGLTVELVFTGTDSGVIETTVKIANEGNAVVAVDFLSAMHLSVPLRYRELLRTTGFWANEFQSMRESVGPSTLTVESLRGRSSHGSSPSIVLGEPGFTEEQGRLISVALCWSGDHRIDVCPGPDGNNQLLVSVPLRAGDLHLNPGASFTAPKALFAYSCHGLNGIRRQSQSYWQQQRRNENHLRLPVHFNSWEASYFDHDESSIRTLMAEAASLGAERFVLDDGWMAGRARAGVGLGDWIPCPDRYPNGLLPLAARARELGMEFGLWIEPEMVTGDSEVARAHPEWILGIPQVRPLTGRGQMLLNISLEAVQRHILSFIDALMADCQPDYLKWDMNRDYAQTGVEAGASALALHLGFRQLLAEVRRRHPETAIEICAAGGARADAGALELADRLWPSDSMDPLQRFAVHRQASLWLPMARLGSHIGSERSATSGRSSPLATRCAVALMGHTGLELDPAALSPQERRVLGFWLDLYKRHRDWLATAERRFLDQRGNGLDAMLAWDDQAARGLLWVLRSDYSLHATPGTLCLPIAPDARRYRVRLLNPEDSAFAQYRSPFLAGQTVTVSGEWLASGGLRAPQLQVDHCAVFELQSCVSSS